MADEQQLSAWREQLEPGIDGLFSVYIPMQKSFRTQKDVQQVFQDYGEIKAIKQTNSTFFVKYKDLDCALAAIAAHHKKHQANVGMLKASTSPSKAPTSPPNPSNAIKINVEKKRLEEDVRGLYTLCIKKDGYTKDALLKIFRKYGKIHDPSETTVFMYVRYPSRQMAEQAIEHESGNHQIHVPDIYFKYRKKTTTPSSSPLATSSSNGSNHGRGDAAEIPSLFGEMNLQRSPEQIVSLPPPAAFSDPLCGRRGTRGGTGGGTRGGAEGLTLDMIRACVQEQIQLQTDQTEYRGSTMSSSDYGDMSLCELFPVHYSFLGLDTDITRDSSPVDILSVVLRPITDDALTRLRRTAQQHFPRAHTFTTLAYDMNLECCLGGGGVTGGVASLAQLHSFMQRKNKELSSKPDLLHSVHAMNRAVLKLSHCAQPESHLAANLWRQWLHALQMAVIECGSECCLSYKALSQSGELVTHSGEPSFAVYSVRPSSATPATDMHALVDLDREPMLVIDLFPSGQSSGDLDSSVACEVVFSDFLDIPSLSSHPPAAFTVPSVWREQLLVHLRHLLSVLQSKHSRQPGEHKYEAFGLIVLHQHDVYVSRLTASPEYLVALKERRPQNRPQNGPRAALSLSRWKLNFALPNHREALAEFIAVLDSC